MVDMIMLSWAHHGCSCQEYYAESLFKDPLLGTRRSLATIAGLYHKHPTKAVINASVADSQFCVIAFGASWHLEPETSANLIGRRRQFY